MTESTDEGFKAVGPRGISARAVTLELRAQDVGDLLEVLNFAVQARPCFAVGSAFKLLNRFHTELSAATEGHLSTPGHPGLHHPRDPKAVC